MGNGELLDEIVAAKPERDHTRFHSFEEMKAHGLQLLADSVKTVEAKAGADEVEDYRRFILTLTHRVAERHKEDGVQISPPEQAAIDDIAAALGASPA